MGCSVLSTLSSARFWAHAAGDKLSGLLHGEDSDFLNLGADPTQPSKLHSSRGNPVGFFHTYFCSFKSYRLFHEFLALWQESDLSSEWKFCLLLLATVFSYTSKTSFFTTLASSFISFIFHLRMYPLSSLISCSSVFFGNTGWCCSIIILT